MHATCRIAAIVSALVFPAAAARAEPLTLSDALRLAQQDALANRKAASEVRRTEWQRTSAWSQVGPKVQLTYDVQWWNNEIRFELPPEFQSLAPEGVSGGVVRPKRTYTFGVTVVQPLSTLYQAFLGVRLASLQVDVARVDEVRVRRETRRQTVETFFEVLKAQAQVASLEAMRRTAQAHLEQVRNFYEQGLSKRDDVLRVEVQAARLSQALVAARTAAEVACGRLALLIGRSPGMDCVLVDDQEPPEVPADPDSLVLEALKTRAEVTLARLALAAARTARLLKAGDYLPQVAGVFNYSRTPSTEFSHPKAWFFGINLTWTPWEWGRTYFELRAATDEVAKAEVAVREVEEFVRLEVRSAWLQVEAARQGLEAAAPAVEQARENLRIQLERARQQLNTTSDVLDAESLLVQAEADRDAARYGYRVAVERLLDAIGR